MALFAPLAVTVQIRFGDTRIFRLSHAVAETAMVLERPVPFEVGRPVMVTFTLPRPPSDDDDGGMAEALDLRAVITLTDDDGEGADGGRGLEFTATVREQRLVIKRYVADRLGLPGAR